MDAGRTRQGSGVGRALGPARASDIARWIIGAIVVAGMYFARSVLVPLTLAVLLSFLLTPIVSGLRRARVPKSIAVVLAVLLALAGIGVTCALLASQASTLMRDAPEYTQRIERKVSSLQHQLEGRFSFLTGDRGPAGANGRAAAARTNLRNVSSPASGLVSVEVHEPAPSPLQDAERVVWPLLAPLETALIVLIVTIFVLSQREDLLDRVIRLWGVRDLHRTTTALRDAGRRLARYFLTQCMVNFCFGTIIWIGLFLIGVPVPGLWGILAGLLRFVPYFGIVLAALAPITLAAAVEPGWSMAVSVCALFLLIEPVIGYVVEPIVYGRSTGLSPISVVVSALFWTWIWGPIGLLLSTPLTLMLVVLGRHVPAFEMFDVLLGDRPALSPAETLYQRVLAGHEQAAVEHAELVLAEWSIERYFDEGAVAALLLGMADCDRGLISRFDLRRVGAAVSDVIEQLVALDGAEESELAAPELSPSRNKPAILLVPGRGPLDDVVARMLKHMLAAEGQSVREMKRGDLARVDWHDLDPAEAEVVCFTGLFDARSAGLVASVADKVRAELPQANVVVGLVPASSDVPEGDDPPRPVTASTLAGLRSLIVSRLEPAALSIPEAVEK